MPSKRITEVQWFLAGLALGGGATLLLAPMSGRQTRQRLVEKGLEGARTTAGTLLGEERVERGRHLYQRGEEIKDIVQESIDIAKRARRVTRPLDEEPPEPTEGEAPPRKS